MIPEIVRTPYGREGQYRIFNHYFACGKCGRELDRSFAYCPGCGERVEWEKNGNELLPQEDETDPLFP